MTCKNAGWISFVVSALLALPVGALAQIEEILVTAQKREESVQDIPISVQAFSGEEIRELGVVRVSEVTTLAPNMAISMQNPANQSIAIRGIGTSDFFGAAPGSVGVYMDEVTMSSPYLTALGLFDMERVEILRGPQNTLFGRNTTGGAVNFISKRPEVGGERDGFIDVTYGSYERIEVQTGASFQLGDTAAVRIAGKSYDRNGIWDNIDDGGSSYGEKDRKAARGTLVWEPTERTTATLGVFWGEEDSEVDHPKIAGVRMTIANGAFSTVLPNGNVCCDGTFVGPQLTGTQIDWEEGVSGTVNGQGVDPNTPRWNDLIPTGSNRHDLEAWGVHLKLEHDFDWAKATSITAYNENQTYFTVSSSGTGNNRPTAVSIALGTNTPEANIVIDKDADFEQFSQEFRLQSPEDQRLRWIAGLYYFREDSVLGQSIAFGPSIILNAPFGPNCNGLGFFGPAPPFCGPPVVAGGSLGFWAVSQRLGQGFVGEGVSDLMPFSIATMENDVWSPYLSFDFDITDQLTLNAGVRYTYDNKQLEAYEVGIIERSNIAPHEFFDNERMRSTMAAQVASGLASSTCTNNGRPCADTSTRPDLKATEWGGKAGLTYRFNDDHMVYGHYSRGFRSGKFDIEFLHGIHTGFPLEDAIPETLDAYEGGYKSSWADGTLQLNLAAFFYEWFDKQTLFVDPVTGPAFSNVPAAESYGFEAELEWAPTDNLFFAGSVGILETEVTKGSGLGSDEEGHELQNAPTESFNLLARWDNQIGPGVLTLQVNFHYRSKAKTALTTLDLVEYIDEVELLGVRGTYVFGPDQQYRIAVFGEDLLESRYCKFHFSLQAINGTVTCNPSEGQAMWGLLAGMRF